MRRVSHWERARRSQARSMLRRSSLDYATFPALPTREIFEEGLLKLCVCSSTMPWPHTSEMWEASIDPEEGAWNIDTPSTRLVSTELPCLESFLSSSEADRLLSLSPCKTVWLPSYAAQDAATAASTAAGDDTQCQRSTLAAVSSCRAAAGTQPQVDGKGKPTIRRRHWTPDEEDRFLHALDKLAPTDKESGAPCIVSVCLCVCN